MRSHDKIGTPIYKAVSTKILSKNAVEIGIYYFCREDDSVTARDIIWIKTKSKH